MNSFLDLAFSLITSPRKAMVVITNSEKLKEGFFFWIFVVLLMAISAFREGPGLILQFALLFLGMGTALLCHSAAIDYISGMWGGMGTAKGITAGFMAASLPLGFSVFFMLIGASGVNEISSAGTFILSPWAFISTFWQSVKIIVSARQKPLLWQSCRMRFLSLHSYSLPFLPS